MQSSLTNIQRSGSRNGEDSTTTRAAKIETTGLRASFGAVEVLHGVNMVIAKGQVTSIIGPSGCGKSTYIRCLNRMHEIVPTASVSGSVQMDGQELYRRDVDPVLLRRKVGMVFQKANPFPTMSVRENALAGLRLTHRLGNRVRTSAAEEIAEQALRQAALWDEVKDRLLAPAASLSGGQQQRLCIARALAVAPEVLLMDEPCSALDPIATARIEELLYSLKQEYTVVIVTHSMQQAARVSDQCAFFLSGDLVEVAPTTRLFTSPSDLRTEDFIAGKFG